MRIVAVQTGLSPDSVLGGSITDREFLTRLANRGVEIHVLAEVKYPIVKHPNFVPHYWWRRVPKRLSYIGNADVALDLQRLLKRLGHVDWIRFNSPYSVGLGTVLAGGKHRIWGSYLHLEERPFWKWVDSWLPRHCDLITCLSEDTRNDLIQRCPAANQKNNVVVPMGIDTGRFASVRRTRQEVRRTLDIDDDEILVLFVGVLIPRKGIGDLIEAWRTVGPHYNNACMLIIGKPGVPHETELVTRLAEQDPRVTHMAGVPYEEIPEYFLAADIFFFPTHLEGFGIVVGEAMACGIPVLTTNAKGVREVVNNETALIADIGRPDQLAEHLGHLLSDPALRQQLGRAGKARIEQVFSWDRVIDTLLAQLENV
jgi:glycosyltransferase involved in cell wall biosynthesis